MRQTGFIHGGAQVHPEIVDTRMPRSPWGHEREKRRLNVVPPRPTGVERTFADDEIIVSKTDPKGRITYANSVFLRVSGFDEAAVVGRPHNLIRHPDMPRVIFKLAWDTIQSGEEIFAYINNLASDGAHYWVLAHLTPSRSREGGAVGYHSNRRSPGRGAVRTIDTLYARLRAEERRHDRPADAMKASGDLLETELAALAMTYDEYVWSLVERDGLVAR